LAVAVADADDDAPDPLADAKPEATEAMVLVVDAVVAAELEDREALVTVALKWEEVELPYWLAAAQYWVTWFWVLGRRGSLGQLL